MKKSLEHLELNSNLSHVDDTNLDISNVSRRAFVKNMALTAMPVS